MLKETVSEEESIVLMDSIAAVDADDIGRVVVAASHGGLSSSEYARRFAIGAVFLNDAGVGKDEAGIAALGILDAHGLPAIAVSHRSARIGDARDMWQEGIVSHVNEAAANLGVVPESSVQEAAGFLAAAISN